MVMDADAPGTPEVLVTSTPAMHPCSALTKFSRCVCAMSTPRMVCCAVPSARRSVAPQGRHHHGIEIQRNPAQLHVDDAVVAHRALDQPRPDEPELQHLAGFRGDGVVARGVRRGAPGRPLDDDRDAGQRRALLTGYFSGNGLLLCKSSRSN